MEMPFEFRTTSGPIKTNQHHKLMGRILFHIGTSGKRYLAIISSSSLLQITADWNQSFLLIRGLLTGIQKIAWFTKSLPA